MSILPAMIRRILDSCTRYPHLIEKGEKTSKILILRTRLLLAVTANLVELVRGVVKGIFVEMEQELA
jgi:hypothetical protein